MKCTKCMATLKRDDFFCTSCFRRNSSYRLSNNLTVNQFLGRIQEVSPSLFFRAMEKPLTRDEWRGLNSSAIRKVMKFLKAGLVERKSTDRLLERLEKLMARDEADDLHIAIVGSIKAGKSTYLNAWSGKDIVSSHVTPETASLTKVRESDRGNSYVKISFCSKPEWKEIWQNANRVFLEDYRKTEAEKYRRELTGKGDVIVDCDDESSLREEIHRWTSSKSAVHFFVKEIVIGTEGLNLPQGVLLVDTPGLHDVMDYRSNITRQYLRRADVVIACVKSDNLTDTESRMLKEIFSLVDSPAKVFVLATQTDSLNRPIEDWEDQNKEWIKVLSRSDAFGSRTLAEKNIIPISGRLHILMRRAGELKKGDDEYFELGSILHKLRIPFDALSENRERLSMFAGIVDFKDRLRSEVIDVHEKEAVRRLDEEYKAVKRDILMHLSTVDQELKNLKGIRSGLMEQSRMQDSTRETNNLGHELTREISHFVRSLKSR